MTLNRRKNVSLTTNWTSKHDEFCLEHGLTYSTKLLWQWLVYSGENKELEPDLQKEFNTWVAKKRGKPYDPKTLKTAIKQLDDCAVINIVRKFSWKVYRIFLRPLEWLTPKKKSRNPAQISNLHPSNALSVEDEVSNNNNIFSSLSDSENKELQRRIAIIKLCEEYGYKDYQKLISSCYSLKEIKAGLDRFSEEEYDELERQHSILHLCAEYGVYFNPKYKNTHELFLYTEEDVKSALEYFVKKGGHELNSKGEPIIPSPNGYVISCLREGWWQAKDFGIAEFLLSMRDFLPKRVPRDYE
jgi:hypothetical protein